MSESLITDWLPRYKFKDWKAKDAEKQARAKKIAEKLNDQEESRLFTVTAFTWMFCGKICN